MGNLVIPLFFTEDVSFPGRCRTGGAVDCCSFGSPCSVGDGPCRFDDDCALGSACGRDNCRDLNPDGGFGEWEDCCVESEEYFEAALNGNQLMVYTVVKICIDINLFLYVVGKNSVPYDQVQLLI